MEAHRSEVTGFTQQGGNDPRPDHLTLGRPLSPAQAMALEAPQDLAHYCYRWACWWGPYSSSQAPSRGPTMPNSPQALRGCLQLLCTEHLSLLASCGLGAFVPGVPPPAALPSRGLAVLNSWPASQVPTEHPNLTEPFLTPLTPGQVPLLCSPLLLYFFSEEHDAFPCT